MDNTLKKILLCITIFISVSSVNFIFAENNEEAYLKEDKLILESLRDNLAYTPHTENVNLDYLYQMIQQQRCAIDIAKNLLNNGGENEEVAQIAKDTIKKQTITIANMENLMQTLINNLTQDKVSEEKYLQEYEKTVKDMMSNLQNLKPTGNVDKNFLQEIIVHNQGTINISNLIIKYTDNNEIKKIAEELKNQQPATENLKKILESIK